jgi:Response regulators consisting of a CheY-like receiver domain and a winged-helix DNA-binding domain
MSEILMVEDDISLIDGLAFALKKNGFQVDVARLAREAEEKTGRKNYDLILLDVSLPDGNGFALCKKIRLNSKTPVIFLTASDEELNIVMGLDLGGDDYITKPFQLNVLISRINALLRRAGAAGYAQNEVSSNGITVRMLENRVFKGGCEIELTQAEFRLLCLLMQNPNVVMTRDILLDKLWDSAGNFVDGNTLSVYISRLRSKIEDDPDATKFLLTVRGVGYKWVVER